MLKFQLYEVINDSLNKDLFSNAAFFGERLMCENDSEESRYLLAKAYQGEGKYHKAQNILKDTKSSQCRYLLAQVCFKLNKLVEAERALLTDKHFSTNVASKELASIIPNGSAGYYLYGKILDKLGSRLKEAICAYKIAIEMDPFMWCAYEELCKLCPATIDPAKYFTDLNPKILAFKKMVQNKENMKNNNLISSTNQPKDFSLSPDNFNQFNNNFGSTDKNIQFNTNKQNKFNSNTGWLFDDNEQHRGTGENTINHNLNPNMTPVVNKDKIDEYQNMNHNHPLIKNRDNLKPFIYSSSPQGLALEFNRSSEVQKASNNSYSNDFRNKFGDSNIKPFNISQTSGATLNNEFTPKTLLGNTNKLNEDGQGINNNIFKNIHLSERDNNNAIGNINNESKFSNSVNNFNLGNSNHQDLSHQQNKNENLNFQNSNIRLGEYHNNNNPAKFNDITNLLRAYSDVLRNFNLFNCEETINLLNKLPINHQKSSWSLVILGRCYLELTKYKECDKAFKECLQLDPARLEGLDYYSSCLWHMRDQFQLVNLASHVLEQSHFAQETWIVVGNCHSLQKEHELALKFFNRAIQIDPHYAYAYTLSGHEYVENESYIQAKQCYHQALNCDDRHYVAWWGLGQINQKEQKYIDALRFYKKALHVNSKSPKLNYYLALAYLENGDENNAMKYLNLAERLDNKSAQVQFKKADIYLRSKRENEALAILLELKERFPKEAAIYKMIGKIYKVKKDYSKSLAHFNTCLDLDPKDSSQVKSEIENLYFFMDGMN